MKSGSLFTGIGGFDLGFAQAGIEPAWQCEIDKAARSVLARRFPGVPCYEDVRNVRRDNVSAVDLICGGFPCQDVSVAGKRAGLAGERSGLWFEFHRIIDELKPQWVVIENVPGLLSSNGGADFAVILRGLVECGYGVAWRILDAQYFGVAQRRRRVFIVGSLGNGRAAEVLFEREGLFGNPPARREAGQGIAGTLGARTEGGGFPGTDESLSGYVVPAYRSSSYGDWREGFRTLRAEGGDLQGGSETLAVVAYNIQHNDGGEHRRKDRPNGGLYITETDTALTIGTTDLTAIASVPPTLSKESYSPSKSSSGQQVDWAIGTSSGVRRLTPTECERLQGFPDGWTDGQSDSARYRQLGNAVAVPVIRWIGERIVEAKP